jgi:hypothetical protein
MPHQNDRPIGTERFAAPTPKGQKGMRPRLPQVTGTLLGAPFFDGSGMGREAIAAAVRRCDRSIRSGIRRAIAVLVLSSILPSLFAQVEDSVQTGVFNFDIDFSRASYLLGDVMITGSYIRSGVGMSRDYQDLTATDGIGVGIESYMALLPKAFFNYGLSYARKGFTHTPPSLGSGITYHMHYIEAPFFLSFELPELREMDFRICVGGQLSYLADAGFSGDLEGLRALPYDRHIFEPDRFTELDIALLFGLSVERGPIYCRARGVVGSAMVSAPNTGQLTSFYFDLGFFPFRLTKRGRS